MPFARTGYSLLVTRYWLLVLLPEQSQLWGALRFRSLGTLFFFTRAAALAASFFLFLMGNVPWGVFSIALSALCFLLYAYFKSGVMRRHRKTASLSEALKNQEEYNVFDLLDFRAGSALKDAIRFWKRYELPYFSYDKFFDLLLKFQESSFVCARVGIPLQDLRAFAKKKIAQILSDPLKARSQIQLEKFLWDAASQALLHDKDFIGFPCLLAALPDYCEMLGQALIQYDLTKEDVAHVAWWQDELQSAREDRRRFWAKKNLRRFGILGENLAAGYTVLLDTISIDLTSLWGRRTWARFIGHEKEFDMMTRVLGRQDVANVLLVGEPGTDRENIVYQFAQKSALGECDESLNFKRVLEIDMVALFAGIKNQGELQERLEVVFGEAAKAKNIIVFIDGIENFVGQDKGGALDIAAVLTQFLKLTNFQVIAVTSFAGFHKMEECVPHLLTFFGVVRVEELSQSDTLQVLESVLPQLEQKYKKFVLYPALRDAVRLSSRYIQTVPFPKRALDLFEEVMVYASRDHKQKIVNSAHVQEVISQITNIPVGNVGAKEREILLNLESLIHKRIIDQNEAVQEVSSALMRARSGVTSGRKGPMGTFLFMGPTGVGKTETAKALAGIYFGAEERMIRIDMSEFQQVEDLDRLLGTSQMEGVLTGQVRRTPFSLILLDEVEKAHPNILNVFLQILDEGHVTDGLGRKIDFSNTIIIATSNAGYQIILDAIKNQISFSSIKEKILDFVFEKGLFRPEFINRFDAVVIFKPLREIDLVHIAALMMKKVIKSLADKHIEFISSDELHKKIVELGYDPTFGARNIRRVIQDRVENSLAKALLSEDLRSGDRITMDAETFEVIKIEE